MCSGSTRRERRFGCESFVNERWLESFANVEHRPVRTFDTACIYYHKFRLVHGDNEYAYVVSCDPFRAMSHNFDF